MFSRPRSATVTKKVAKAPNVNRSLNEATNAACNMRSMAKPASAMIKAFGACSIKREKAGDSSPKITASNPVKIPAV